MLDNDFISNIKYVFGNYDEFEPREFFLENGYDKKSCMNKWKDLVNAL